MYGSECWVVIKKHKTRLTAMKMRFLRSHVRNTFVYEEYIIENPLLEIVDIT